MSKFMLSIIPDSFRNHHFSPSKLLREIHAHTQIENSFNGTIGSPYDFCIETIINQTYIEFHEGEKVPI